MRQGSTNTMLLRCKTLGQPIPSPVLADSKVDGIRTHSAEQGGLSLMVSRLETAPRLLVRSTHLQYAQNSSFFGDLAYLDADYCASAGVPLVLRVGQVSDAPPSPLRMRRFCHGHGPQFAVREQDALNYKI